jgi:cephalosporin hydroxylase
MRNRGPGNLDALIGRPKILEDGLKLDNSNYSHYLEHYGYMMFMLPILLNAKIVVETGLGFGSSTRLFLESLSMMEGERTLHTYTLEHKYGEKLTTEIEAEIRRLPFKTEWQLHMGDSAEAGRNWVGPKIPLIYLDSAHELGHVKKELEMWIPHMTEKAVIFTDDIWHENKPHAAINLRNPGVYPCDPYWAFEDYAKSHPEWKQLSMSYPTGKAFLLRGFDIT